ncbi:Not1 N-terminal domain, CCR4-Not complex component-domain-containing protein [Lasiosphaeria miniovina]|uniref:General negative regulator of transcription subunit n=1 Tax=Lasiosphaeria miniovina TaxID=1954250 RepID=A0AA40BFK4_9PEZI|nr:Not1 N-terminal domain, CCR4-Not complex component-domain-containing protein [Lasiosphaeria miniovina]KAK0733317.1 Not1 N-terminal domain, CCR4-Not complex component-domain-containing protein [Lasiosphaeria miniovina]
MAARKLAQEVDKCFKKVAEGVAEFEGIYEKIEQSNNPAQKEKLEDQLKREIKKLQRLRDQIKTWAASNDIKDKAPLLDHRRLIETQMEKFKAVEKAMKTKAYSKEGLSAAAKLDPKEQAKMEACEFLSNTVDELEQQIEALEAEGEAIQATMKKGKGHSAKADRMAEIERIIERHKWHQGKLELIRRSLENGGVETEQVTDLEESIKYYVSDGMNDDFMEDDGMYDDLNLEEEEDVYGMNQEGDKGSSQDTQSVQDDIGEPETRAPSVPAAKQRATVDAAAASSGRRPSTQLKSPLPTLATVHSNPLPTIGNGSSSAVAMKPASVPTRPAGEGLKYASAAAAAAASDKNNVGIAPLPPPPSATPSAIISPLPASQPKTSTANSPSSTSIQPVQQDKPTHAVPAPTSMPPTVAPAPGLPAKPEATRATSSRGKAPAQTAASEPIGSSLKDSHQGCRYRANILLVGQTNGTTNGIRPIEEEEEEEESIYHLPASLQDLVESFEITKKRPAPPGSPTTQRMQASSEASKPEAVDAEAPRSYQPEVKYHTHTQFPQEPLSIFDDPRLYSRIDPDTLFYVFYYKQGTYQQYLAAKALKDQSWRFHKQYQTWFQRHEEPKSITEEFEQGTYRFFDYESTWMNRRKADFKFAYKFLEDDV